jgi:putative FmdB family regulatory protein
VPVYEYACTECGERLEARQSFTDEPLTECPVCSGRLRKVLSPVGVVFKGSGFYRNDSRVSSGDSADTKDKKDKKDSKASESGPTKESSSSGSSGSSSSASDGGSTSSGSDTKSSASATKAAASSSS